MRNRKQGFTLIEILLVVAAIGILAGIVILAINPNKQLGDTKNAQRSADVNTILNAVYQYVIDSNGVAPATITNGVACGVATQEVCKTGGTCTGLTDLGVLTTNAKYLVAIPTDPVGVSTNGAGYEVYKNATTNRITVCAPDAEQGATISVTR
ncbi:MAG: type II secretion system protein [bacterium]|nr:type II secretion system protein [bacterium]